MQSSQRSFLLDNNYYDTPPVHCISLQALIAALLNTIQTNLWKTVESMNLLKCSYSYPAVHELVELLAYLLHQLCPI